VSLVSPNEIKMPAKKPGKMVLLNDINRRLTEFRNKAPGILGIPFEEILQRCGITKKYYLFCEHGRRRLRADHLARLQSEFKLNSNWMLGSNEPMFLLEVDFNPRLKEFRETAPGILGIPFDEILKKCGISGKNYRAYEQGLKYPPVEHLFSLCRECHLNINWLLGLKTSMFSIKAVDP